MELSIAQHVFSNYFDDAQVIDYSVVNNGLINNGINRKRFNINES